MWIGVVWDSMIQCSGHCKSRIKGRDHQWQQLNGVCSCIGGTASFPRSVRGAFEGMRCERVMGVLLVSLAVVCNHDNSYIVNEFFLLRCFAGIALFDSRASAQGWRHWLTASQACATYMCMCDILHHSKVFRKIFRYSCAPFCWLRNYLITITPSAVDRHAPLPLLPVKSSVRSKIKGGASHANCLTNFSNVKGPSRFHERVWQPCPPLGPPCGIEDRQ